MDSRRLGWPGRLVAVSWMLVFSGTPLAPVVSTAAMPDDCHECCEAMVGVPHAPMPGHDMPRCCVMEGAPAPVSTPARLVNAAPAPATVLVVVSAWFQPAPPAAVPTPAGSPPLSIPALQRTSVLLI